MAGGEGTYWEGPVTNKDGVTLDVMVASFPMTGAVRIKIETSDTPLKIAGKLAKAWNAGPPIKDVCAVADKEKPIMGFFLTGPLDDGKHMISEMGVTFDGKAREVITPTHPASSSYNPNLTVKRVCVWLSKDPPGSHSG